MRAWGGLAAPSSILFAMATSATPPNAAYLQRVKGALWGCLAGDGLAMPVHWYYSLAQLQHDFPGGIRQYEAPVSKFPGSIMSLSNTGGGGRGSDQGSIVGDVILHGKKKFWKRGGNFHYHHGMRPGENTLEAQLMRLVVRSLTASSGALDAAALRKGYIDFMTTEGSHNDTYASTCHRMFFANMQAGVPPERCPDNDQHNVDTMDGMVMAIPLMLAQARDGDGTTGGDGGGGAHDAQIRELIGVTRNSRQCGDYAVVLSSIFRRVLQAPTSADPAAVLRDAVEDAASRHFRMDLKGEVARAGRSDPMTA